MYTRSQQVANISSRQPNDRSKKLFIILIVLWLASLPGAIILELALRAISPNGNGPGTAIVNIISLLVSFWFFIGWVPVVIVGISRGKKAKT